MLELLKPFIVTSAHAGKNGVSDLEPEVQQIFTRSGLAKDPNRLNVFMFVLSHEGQVVHEFHGLPGGGRAADAPGRSQHAAELAKAIEKLPVPPVAPARDNGPDTMCRSLPDLAGSTADPPAGVRIFVRQDDPRNSHSQNLSVVQVVAMKADEWKALSFAPEPREIAADVLKRWLVWLYPAGIRTADESKRFQEFAGTLRLEPSHSDEKFRHAVLRGDVRLAKEDDTQSAFEGTLEAVLSYRPDSPEVHSVRAAVEGVYIYRVRTTSEQRLRVAIESRPDASESGGIEKREKP